MSVTYQLSPMLRRTFSRAKAAKPLKVLLLSLLLLAPAQVKAAEEPRPSYRPLRFDEDWSALRDPARHNQPFDSLKFIPFGDSSSLTLGGDFRLRLESYNPRDFGFGGVGDETFMLGRAYVHANVRLGQHVRTFIELRAADVWGESTPARPLSSNPLEVNQVFVDFSAPLANGTGSVRLGRHEMLFGSGRLTGPRDGPNIRLSFDGVRASWSANGRRLDTFFVRPVQLYPNAFDDRSTRAYQFWGAYLVQPTAPNQSLDLYFMGLERGSVTFAQGTAREERYTVGARWAGRHGGWDWDLEAVYQFGSFGAGDISAYAFANEVGYTWRSLPWTPRLAARLDLFSGDEDLGNPDLNTFEVPFAKIPYLVEAELAGQANAIDLHPILTVSPTKTLSLTAEYMALWKHRQADTYYLPPLRPVRPTAGGSSFAAHFVQMTGRWTLSPQTSVNAVYTRGMPGRSLKAAGAKTTDALFLITTFRF